MTQTKLVFGDVAELLLDPKQSATLADLLASQKHERKTYLFILATDSYLPGCGSIPRLQCRIIGDRLYGKISKLLS
jgi:hypothetical protein